MSVLAAHYIATSGCILSPSTCSNASYDSCGHCSIHHSALKCFSGNAPLQIRSSVLLQSTSYFTVHMYSCLLSEVSHCLGQEVQSETLRTVPIQQIQICFTNRCYIFEIAHYAVYTPGLEPFPLFLLFLYGTFICDEDIQIHSVCMWDSLMKLAVLTEQLVID